MLFSDLCFRLQTQSELVQRYVRLTKEMKIGILQVCNFLLDAEPYTTNLFLAVQQVLTYTLVEKLNVKKFNMQLSQRLARICSMHISLQFYF